ncbi:MAG: universal stress protein [Syntrophothermus sp.]
MSSIIVAIDFAESSMNAFLHALSIAQVCHKDLNMVWVQKAESDKDKLDKSGDQSQEAKNYFEEIISKYQKDLPKNKIYYTIKTGKVFKEITELAKETKAWMVITGTHGATVFVEFWIGSNANRIVSLAPCPVITIRSGIDVQRPLTKIILPIDHTMETRQKAPFTGVLAKSFGAEVVILSLYTSKVKAVRQNIDLYSKQVSLYFDEEGIKYSIDHMQVENLADDLIQYAKEKDANLISIMSEQGSSMMNLWMGPFAQQIVNRSPIPVLCIRSRETLASGVSF